MTHAVVAEIGTGVRIVRVITLRAVGDVAACRRRRAVHHRRTIVVIVVIVWTAIVRPAIETESEARSAAEMMMVVMVAAELRELDSRLLGMRRVVGLHRDNGV